MSQKKNKYSEWKTCQVKSNYLWKAVLNPLSPPSIGNNPYMDYPSTSTRKPWPPPSTIFQKSQPPYKYEGSQYVFGYGKYG